MAAETFGTRVEQQFIKFLHTKKSQPPEKSAPLSAPFLLLISNGNSSGKQVQAREEDWCWFIRRNIPRYTTSTYHHLVPTFST